MSTAKYLVIDVTHLTETRVIAVAHLREAEAMGKIQKANGRQLIAPPLTAKGLAKLELNQLQYLFWNMTQTPPGDEYGELLKAVKAAADALEVDKTPLDVLDREVARLYPEEGAPQTKTPKAPKVEGAPAERPKGTSTTGRVWEIADACFNGDPATADWKTIRAAIVAKCEAEGINKATAATQYSKWKASKLSPA